jgi:hypothetical protein
VRARTQFFKVDCVNKDIMLMIFLTVNPELKKALSRMFGME